MRRPSTPTTILTLTAVIAVAVMIALFLVAEPDRQPPQFDDEEQRLHAQTRYDAVYDTLGEHRGVAAERLDEAQARVAKTGEIGFPQIELDELLEDEPE